MAHERLRMGDRWEPGVECLKEPGEEDARASAGQI